MKYKNILIDIENKNVFENDKPVTISAKEFEVLRCLVTNKGLLYRDWETDRKSVG